MEFSIDVPTGGFSSQLARFVVLYKIGRYLGLSYRHVPMRNERSDSEIWRFAQLDGLFSDAASSVEGLPRVVVERRHVQTAKGLDRLKSEIGDVGCGGRLVLDIAPNARKWAFRLLREERARFSDWLDGSLPDLLNRTQAQSPFSATAGRRILVHVRRGDTASILMPSGEIVGFYGPNPRPVYSPELSPARYATLLDDLHALFPEETTEIVGFSDGYERLARYARAVYPGEYAARIAETAAANEEQLKGIFERRGVPFQCGETFASLKSLLVGLQEADIVLCSPNQRMPAKVLGLLGDPERRQTLVHLHLDWPVDGAAPKETLTETFLINDSLSMLTLPYAAPLENVLKGFSDGGADRRPADPLRLAQQGADPRLPPGERRALLEELRRLLPHEPGPCAALAALAMESGSPDGAARMMDRARALYGEDRAEPRAWVRLRLRIALRQGRFLAAGTDGARMILRAIRRRLGGAGTDAAGPDAMR